MSGLSHLNLKIIFELQQISCEKILYTLFERTQAAFVSPVQPSATHSPCVYLKFFSVVCTIFYNGVSLVV